MLPGHLLIAVPYTLGDRYDLYFLETSIYAGWSGAHGRTHLLLLDEALLLHSGTGNCVYPRVPSWIRHWTAADVSTDQSEAAMEARGHIPGYMEGTSPGYACVLQTMARCWIGISLM